MSLSAMATSVPTYFKPGGDGMGPGRPGLSGLGESGCPASGPYGGFDWFMYERCLADREATNGHVDAAEKHLIGAWRYFNGENEATARTYYDRSYAFYQSLKGGGSSGSAYKSQEDLRAQELALHPEIDPNYYGSAEAQARAQAERDAETRSLEMARRIPGFYEEAPVIARAASDLTGRNYTTGDVEGAGKTILDSTPDWLKCKITGGTWDHAAQVCRDGSDSLCDVAPYPLDWLCANPGKTVAGILAIISAPYLLPPIARTIRGAL